MPVSHLSLLPFCQLPTSPHAPAEQINLTQSTSSTLPFENGRQIRTLAVSPDGRLLVSVDEEGRALVINRHRRTLLHHFSFKGVVRAAAFSPDGRYLAVAVGRLLQVQCVWRGVAGGWWRWAGRPPAGWRLQRDGLVHVYISRGGQGEPGRLDPVLKTIWPGPAGCLPHPAACPVLLLLPYAAAVFFRCRCLRCCRCHRCLLLPLPPSHPPPRSHTPPPLPPLPCPQVWKSPGLEKTTAPMELHRTYGQCHDDVVALDWAPDSQWLAGASLDLTTRVFSLNPLPGYRPPTLMGHREAPVAVCFTPPRLQEAAGLLGKAPPALYSLSRDGALFAWAYEAGVAEAGAAAQGEEEGEEEEGEQQQQQQQSQTYAGGHWRLAEKHYFHQRGAKLTAAAFHAGAGLLAAGFSNGIFDLLQLPDLTTIHTLSVGRERISSLAFNAGGDWIAVGSAKLGQLLVWEWRSETYVLKQQVGDWGWGGVGWGTAGRGGVGGVEAGQGQA